MMARERQVPVTVSNVHWITFFVFMVMGAAYIAAAKFNSFPAAAVTLVPVGLMFVYAGLVKFVGIFRLRDDQSGDNLYYLGFLYTLTSLGVSLYQFTADGPAEEIVQNFGVAIGSTITGVALRVIFNQMRRDPADVEQASRIELSEAARRMRNELDASVVELAHFRRSAQQQVSEGFEHVRAGMEEVSGRILSTFEEMTLRAAKPFEAASEHSSTVLAALATTIGESLDGAARRLADENEKLAAGTSNITSALSLTAERLATMQTPDKIIEVRFEPIAAALAASMEGFAEQIRQKDEIDRGVIEAITRSGTQHQKQATTLINLAKALEKRTEAMMASEQVAGERAERTLRLLVALEADRTRSAAEDAAREQRVAELAEATASLTVAAALLGAKATSGAMGEPSPADDPDVLDAKFQDELSKTLEMDLEGSFEDDGRSGPPVIQAVR